MTKRRFDSVLPLQVFIQRTQVRQLFRSLLKATRSCSDPQLKAELRQHIVSDFRKNQHLQDNHAIRSLIQEGLRSVKKVQDISEATRPKPPPEFSEQKSWLEEGDEDDKRGRIGEGWPWDASK